MRHRQAHCVADGFWISFSSASWSKLKIQRYSSYGFDTDLQVTKNPVNGGLACPKVLIETQGALLCTFIGSIVTVHVRPKSSMF